MAIKTPSMRGWFGRGKSLQFAISGCCLLAFTLFGYDQGVFSGILENEDWLNQFGHPNDTKTGIIVSSYNLGCLLGCFSTFCPIPLPSHYRSILSYFDSQFLDWKSLGPEKGHLARGLHHHYRRGIAMLCIQHSSLGNWPYNHRHRNWIGDVNSSDVPIRALSRQHERKTCFRGSLVCWGWHYHCVVCINLSGIIET